MENNNSLPRQEKLMWRQIMEELQCVKLIKEFKGLPIGTK